MTVSIVRTCSQSECGRVIEPEARFFKATAEVLVVEAARGGVLTAAPLERRTLIDQDYCSPGCLMRALQTLGGPAADGNGRRGGGP